MNEIRIKGIKRLNEFANPELLGEDEATELKNLVLDETGGRPVKRGAFKRFDTSHTASGRLYSLYDVTDGTNDYLIGITGTVLQKSQGGIGAWSNLKTGLTTSLKARITKFKDKYVLTNGTDKPFITDITSAWDLDIDRPNIQSLVNGTASGGNLTASALYRYILVYVTEDGNYSNISFPFTYITSATDIDSTDGTNKTITFSSIPVSSDTRVTGRKLFRTKADSLVYYLCASLNNTDTTYTDTKADTDLDTNQSIELISVPTKAEYSVYHKGRLFLGNISRTATNIVTVPAHIPFTGTPADNGGAGMADGVYKYRMSYLDVQGRESELSTYITVDVDHTVIPCTSGEAKVAISSIPRPRIGAGELDSEIAKIRIYRTEASGSTYYWLKDIGVETTATEDAVNDSSLSSDTYPKSGTGGTSSEVYPSGLVFSEIEKVNTFPTANFRQIFPDDGDEITGIVDEQDGILVFKRNSIRKVYTQGNSINWRIVTITESIGCDEPETISVSPYGVYFVNNNKLYRYSNGSYEEVGITIKNTLNNIATFTASVYLNKLNWYVLVADSIMLVYDENVQSWYYFSFDDIGTIDCLVEKKLGTARGAFLISGNTGQILTYDKTTSLDYDKTTTGEDSEILPSLKSKVFVFPDANAKFRLRKVFANYKKKDGQSVTHKLIEHGKSDVYLSQKSDSTNSSYASDYKDFEADTDSFTSPWKEGEKLQYQITGYGLTEFNSARIMYHIINKGSRV